MVLAALWVASPAQAFAHNAIKNPYLHALFDGLTLAVVTAPLWSAYLWGRGRRSLLLALIGAVQVPVAVIAFVPIDSPVLHAILLPLALIITVASVVAVRRADAVPEPAPAPH
ncbi:hypothetical protein [Pilimelia anulata]|nr:hypothetical protein [Pilimelia anulata]